MSLVVATLMTVARSLTIGLGYIGSVYRVANENKMIRCCCTNIRCLLHCFSYIVQ